MALLSEAIADAADGFDAVGRIAELAAQGLDVHVDGALQDDGAVADGGVHEVVRA